jgi:hypothetical protein
MVLERFPCAFSQPDWIFEIKHDGFRAMAYVESGEAKLISRRDHHYKSFDTLCHSIGSQLKHRKAILDGEIVSLDHKGVAQFKELMYRRHEPRFYAFDVLWFDDKDRLGRKSRILITPRSWVATRCLRRRRRPDLRLLFPPSSPPLLLRCNNPDTRLRRKLTTCFPGAAIPTAQEIQSLIQYC